MATRKRNEWLEAEESDDDQQGYDSEDESKSHLLRTTKRQKVSHDSDDEYADADDIPNDTALTTKRSSSRKHKDQDDASDSDTPETAHLKALAASLPNSKSLSLTGPLSLTSQPKKDKSGIIYLSRCPPFMKPSVLRSLLTPYGSIGRIFLTPEPSTQRTQRLKSGGTRRKLFLDGWVEFTKKKDAKFVAENLNAQTMGGKKRGRWHDEVWNIKYLKGVKWGDLVEQIQNENAERQARMRTEIAQGKRENERFLQDVERGKMERTMEERRKQRGGDEEGDVDGDGAEEEQKQEQKEVGKGKKGRRSKMEFRQSVVKKKGDEKSAPGQDTTKVLGMIF